MPIVDEDALLVEALAALAQVLVPAHGDAARTRLYDHHALDAGHDDVAGLGRSCAGDQEERKAAQARASLHCGEAAFMKRRYCRTLTMSRPLSASE